MSWHNQDVASLPGVRAHLEGISTDLDDGHSCVWLVPDDLVGRGVAEELLNTLAARPDSVRVPPPRMQAPRKMQAYRQPTGSSGTLPSWARSTLGLLDDVEVFEPLVVEEDDDTDTIAERVLAMGDGDTLLSAEWLRGKVIVLCAWEEQDTEDVGSTLTRLSASVKERGLPPEQRPRLLVAARDQDLPVGTLNRLDALTTRVHWWWGVLGRLDTAVVTAGRRRRQRQADRAAALRAMVATEVLIEVAGPDLVLAERLAADWDGRIATLKDVLAAAGRDAQDAMPASSRAWPANGDRPPQELRAAWQAGFVDRWDRRITVSPAADGVLGHLVDLDALVWRGQHRALTPLMDDHRARLELVVRSRADKSALVELESRTRTDGAGSYGRNTLEVGAMAWTVGTGRVRIPRGEAQLLYCLRDIRNALAHLSPLTDEDVDRLARLLPE